MSETTLFEFLPTDAVINIVRNTNDPLFFINAPLPLRTAARALIDNIVLFLKPGFHVSWKNNALFIGPPKENNEEHNKQKKLLLQVFGDVVERVDFRFAEQNRCKADIDILAEYCPAITEFDSILLKDANYELFQLMLSRYASQLTAVRMMHGGSFVADNNFEGSILACTALKTLNLKGGDVTKNIVNLLSGVGEHLECLFITTKEWIPVLDAVQTHCRSLRTVLFADIQLTDNDNWDAIEEKAADVLISYGAQLTKSNLSFLKSPGCSRVIAACPNLSCSYNIKSPKANEDINDRFKCVQIIGAKLDKMEIDIDWYAFDIDIELLKSALSECTFLTTLIMKCRDEGTREEGEVDIPDKILRAVFSAHLVCLEHLFMDGASFDISVMELMARNTRDIREFTIYSNEFIDDGTTLGNVLKANQKLETVTLYERSGTEMKSEEDVLRILRGLVECLANNSAMRLLDVQVFAPDIGDHMDEMRTVCLPMRRLGAECRVSSCVENFTDPDGEPNGFGFLFGYIFSYTLMP